MSNELARAARELLASASDPIRFPMSTVGDETVHLVPTSYLEALREALEPIPAPRPCVSVSPTLKFGQACLHGTRLPADLIADRYWEHGEQIGAEVMLAYEVTRAQVLACCFYVATCGTRKQRARWKAWLGNVWAATGPGTGWWSDDGADVPLPPTRLSITCEPSPDARIENGGG